jgi:hypothetical protein
VDTVGHTRLLFTDADQRQGMAHEVDDDAAKKGEVEFKNGRAVPAEDDEDDDGCEG